MFSIETNNVKRWFLKKPVRYLEDINYILGVEFEDGEICDYTIWTKYLHREDGPAEEYSNGQKYWWWHGEYLEEINSQEEFETWKRFINFR